MIKEVFESLKIRPCIHCITNYVTVNDVANILLACGASPVMSDEPLDVSDITSISDGLYLNIGTLNKSSIEAMNIAGKKANTLGIPVVLDPVGAGASKLRTQTAVDIIKTIKLTVIRGNLSEIKALAGAIGLSKNNYGQLTGTKGVDASKDDCITEDNIESRICFVKDFALKVKTIVAVTGAIDIISDGQTTYIVRNGLEQMSLVTGTGCQLSALTTAFVAANKGNELEAAATSVCLMGLCGEIAWSYMKDGEGNASYGRHIIDAVYNMTSTRLKKGARYEVR